MSLPVLCSLALMLLLFASILHLVSLALPAWVQMGMLVPVFLTAPGGGQSAGESAGQGESVEALTNATAQPQHAAVRLQGPLMFVKIRLGLWAWCDQFVQLDPDCQHPGFLNGVMLVGVVALVTVPLSFVLLALTSCLDTDPKKKRVVTLSTFILALISGLLLLLAVAVYAILTRWEVNRMLQRIGEHRELPYLGWAYGAEAIVCVLVCVAALCLGIHLRSTPKATPEFQLVV